MSERGRESHVDRDRVAVTQRDRRHQLERRRPGVAKGDDTVEADLVQVRRLELEHDLRGQIDRSADAHLDAAVDNLIGGLADLGRRALDAAEARLDEVLAVLLEQAPRADVADRADLDELREAVADCESAESEGPRRTLANRQSRELGEVEEGDDRRAASVSDAQPSPTHW